MNWKGENARFFRDGRQPSFRTLPQDCWIARRRQVPARADVRAPAAEWRKLVGSRQAASRLNVGRLLKLPTLLQAAVVLIELARFSGRAWRLGGNFAEHPPPAISCADQLRRDAVPDLPAYLSAQKILGGRR